MKYKGKKINNSLFEEWVVGDLSHSIDGQPCINPRTYYATKDLGDEIEDELPKLVDGFAIGEFFLVHPESVGIGTGFKDKKGNEIFSGDIVNDGLGLIIWCERTGMFRVKWHQKNYVRIRSMLDVYKENGEPLFLNSEIVWEVIGNKFDNPELLKHE